MRHELGHDKIAKGEVDIKAVRAKLSKKVGTNNVTLVAELYNEAYAGTGMTAEEIWEECICDSFGEMNIFASDEIAGELFDKILPEISKAAKSSKSSEKTRGSPEGKTSRETSKRRRVPPRNDFATDAMIWAHSDKTLIGEQKFFSRNDKWVLLEKSDDGYVEMGSYTNAQRKVFIEEIESANEAIRNSIATAREGLCEDFGTYASLTGSDLRYNGDAERQRARNDRSGSIYQSTSRSNGVADNQGSESGSRSEIKRSSPEEAKESGKASRELDTTYLDAVNRGDMVTAQRMVDERDTIKDKLPFITFGGKNEYLGYTLQ